MKSANFKNVYLLMVTVAALGLTIGLVSWDHRQSPGKYEQTVNDTTPRKLKEKKIRDLDEILEEMNEADLKINLNEMKKEIAEALKEINTEKIKSDVEKAIKEIDLDKIKAEVEASLAKADLDQIKKQIQDALTQLDVEKIEKEIKESIAKVDWEKLKTEMEKVEKEMKDLGPKLEKEMEKAKESLQKAKAEIQEFKSFVDGLEKEGLINKKEGYTLKHKEGVLLINGKKASDQIYNKYRSFLEKHTKFNIEKSDDDFDIDID